MAEKLWSVLSARMAMRPWMLGDDDLGAAFVEVGDDGIAVERLVGDQATEIRARKQGRDADGIKPMAR